MDARADRFPLFDSLRAIAALAIVGVHASFFSGILGEGDSPLRPYAARLDVGVTVFFLISGFLLYRPFVRARLRGEPVVPARVYAWRRLLRIGPAYWVALTLVALVTGATYVFTAKHIVVFYGFGQIYSSNTALGGISQAWTLCVEVSFYALLPLWAFVLGRRRTQTPLGRLRLELGALAGLFLAGVAFKLWALGWIDPNGFVEQPWLLTLPNFLDHFAVGMGLAVLHAWYEDRPLPAPLAALARRPGLCWLAALVAFWAVSTQIGLSGEFGETLTRTNVVLRHGLYGVVAFGIVLPAVVGDQRQGLVRRFLGHRVLLSIGLVSYGLYLYHLAFLGRLAAWGYDVVNGTEGPIAFALWWLGGALGGIALGALSYRLVERPALRLKGLVGPRRDPAPGEATAESAPVAVEVETPAPTR